MLKVVMVIAIDDFEPEDIGSVGTAFSERLPHFAFKAAFPDHRRYCHPARRIGALPQ